MKRVVLYFLALVAFNFAADAQNVNIPDPNFKSYLVANNFIDSNLDDEVQVSEAANYAGVIKCNNKGINDLTGIEAFTSIVELDCSQNNLTSLNVSQNTALKILNCFRNDLVTLDLSQNTLLEELICLTNDLIELDLSQNTALLELKCQQNDLTTLNLSQNTALELLQCRQNDLTGLDLSQNIALEYMDCGATTLSTLDVSQNVNLKDLYCGNNNLSQLDLSQNSLLTTVYCINNNISSLDISQNTALKNLNCQNNNLSSLDVSLNSELLKLEFPTNNLSSVDISQNLALKELNCAYNNIDNLDVSHNTALSLLSCGSNDLKQLNLKNIGTATLTHFWAYVNPNLICIEVDDVAAANAAWQNIDAASSFGQNCAVFVQSISVQGQAGASTITTAGGTLQMEASLLPMNADDNSFTWSVTDGTGSATISQTGLLTEVTDGTVTVTATANDGSGISGSAVITISTPILVSSITVQGEAGASTITTAGGTLQMEGSVLPMNANDNSFTWSVTDGTGSASIDQTGLLTAMTNGTVTVAATANDGSGVSGTSMINISNQLIVTSINVQGQGGISTITTMGGTLQMEASVFPANADDASYTWMVTGLTGLATISGDGLLTALSDGTVSVIAAANDDSGVMGTMVVTISNQSVGVKEEKIKSNISIYPNPTNSIITIDVETKIQSIVIVDIMGKTLKRVEGPNNTINVADLVEGVYFLQIQTDGILDSKKMIIN